MAGRTRKVLKAMRRVVVIGVAVAATVVALEYIIRVVTPQPLHYYDFEIRDGGAALVAGNTVLARQVLPPGQGPYTAGIEYWMGRYRVRINSKGWRDVEHAIQKPPGVIRLGVIGDSVTFGTGAAIEDVYFRVLEDLLHEAGFANVEVLGFAGGATNAYFARILLEDVIDVYDLDAVLLGFNQNDIIPSEEIAAAAKRVAKRRRTAGVVAAGIADRLFRADSHLFHLFRERSKAILRRAGVLDPTMRTHPFLNLDQVRSVKAWNDTQEILRQMNTYLGGRAVPFMILILPIDIQTGPKVAQMYRSDGFSFSTTVQEGLAQRLMHEFTKTEGILLADPLPRFRQDQDLVKFIRTEGGSIDWAHMNTAGHRITAETIRDVILDNPGFLIPEARRVDWSTSPPALQPKPASASPPGG